MTFINWGHETPEQKELRRRLEEQEFFQNAVSRRLFEQRGANSAAAAASAGAAGGGGSRSNEGLSLTLEFSSVAGAQAYVANLTSVAEWNAFFDLPDNGDPFTGVEVDEATVSLYGGSDIIMRSQLFTGVNSTLILVDDQAGCIIGLNNYVFGLGKTISQTNLVSVNLPAVETAGNSCFSKCNSLTAISLPLLETAGIGLFQECSALTTISLPLLETAGSNFFASCSALTSAVLPTLTVAPDGLFNECSNLINVSMPMVTSAEGSCFANCTALTSVSLPALTEAGERCFQSCFNLETVNLPLLTLAGNNCFQQCSSLTSINLPSCTNLGGTVGNNNVFLGIIGNTIQLTVPAALMTNNGGNPDGDIQYLQANNTVTVTQVIL